MTWALARGAGVRPLLIAGLLSALLCALVMPVVFYLFPRLDYITELNAGASVWRDADKVRDVWIIPLTLAVFGGATLALLTRRWPARFGERSAFSARLPTMGAGESLLAVAAAVITVAVPQLAPHALPQTSPYLLPGVLLHVLYRHLHRARHGTLPPSIEIVVATGMLTAASQLYSPSLGPEIALRALIIAQILHVLLFAVSGGVQRLVRLALAAFGYVSVAVAALHWMPSLRLPAEMLQPGLTLRGLEAAIAGLSLAVLLEGVLRLGRAARRADGSGAALYGPLLAVLFVTGALGIFSPIPGIPADDYHFGEAILPFWQAFGFGDRLFLDLMPPHGWVDLAGQALAFSAFDGTAAAAIVGEQFVKLFLRVAAGLVIAAALPRTALVFVLWAMSPVVAIYVAYGGAILLITASPWFAGLLPLYVIASALMAFSSIGLGGTLVLASILPIGARFVLEARKSSLRLVIATALSVAAAAAVVIMFLPEIKSILAYARTSSATNLTIYGVSWDEGWTLSKSLIVDIVRFSWVFALGIALCAVIHLLANREQELRVLQAAAFGFLIVFGLLTVPYTNGRLDPQSLSRAGFLTMVLWPLLPLAYRARSPGRPTPLAAVAVLALAPIVQVPMEGVRHAFTALDHHAGMLDAAPDPLRFGNAVRTPAHFEEVGRISRALAQLLAPEERFLNATNRNALHFYTNRPSPIAIPAFYNAAPIAFQKTALERLRAAPPAIALLNADTPLFDGGPLGVRTHLLYRFILDNYRPFTLDGFVFGVLKGEEQRLEKAGASLAPATLFTQLFQQKDLKSLPSAWGRSEGTLKDDLRRVERPIRFQQAVHLAQEAEGTWRTGEPDPHLIYETDAFPGRSAGLLSFDLTCREPKRRPLIQLFWAEKGKPFSEERAVTFRATGDRQIVPLDADPQWLAAGAIDRIRIDLDDSRDCAAFKVDSLEFSQRTALDGG